MSKFLDYLQIIVIVTIGFTLSILSFTFWYIVKGEKKANKIKREFIEFLKEYDQAWQLVQLR